MRSIVLDANLLVLLVVGLVDKRLIATHKRTKSFEPEDFELLSRILNEYDQVVVTPNVMTEAANLVAYTVEPTLTAVRQKLASLVGIYHEIYCPSTIAVGHPEFIRLGLTDCGLLDIAGESTPLLTTDLDLYLTALRKNSKAANFNHIRQDRLLNH